MSDVLEVLIPELDLDPFSDGFLSEPYRLHEIMREAGPVVRLTRYGILGFARYADIRSILLDWQTFCSSAGVGITNFRNETPWRPPSVLLEANPPLHDRTRGVLNRIMSPGLLPTCRKSSSTRRHPCRRTRGARGDRCRCGPRRAISREGIFYAMGLPEEGREHLLAYSNILFAVEFARASTKRACAPTLVPVRTGGNTVIAQILLVDVAEQEARDRLWRREIDKVGQGGHYRKHENPGPNTLVIDTHPNFEGIDWFFRRASRRQSCP